MRPIVRRGRKRVGDGVSIAGVGVDTVDVSRFREILERRPGLIERVFTEAERKYAESVAQPAQAYAVRFAAKEATMKALGVGIGGFDFHDVEVTRSDRGAPSLVVVGKAAELANAAAVKSWHVSLTHTCSAATAMVIAEQE